MTVTPLYAGILALIFVALSVRVIGMRRAARVAFGDGGDRRLLRRLRAHGNFAEYVPLGLILLGLAELQSMPGWMLHAIGLPLLLGRAAHACAVSQNQEPTRLRVAGMALTFVALTIGAATNIATPLLAAAKP